MPMVRSQGSYALGDADRSSRTGGCRHETPCETEDDERTFYFNLIFIESLANLNGCNRIALKPSPSLSFRRTAALSPVSSRFLLIPAKTPKTVSPYHCFHRQHALFSAGNETLWTGAGAEKLNVMAGAAFPHFNTHEGDVRCPA